MRSTTKDRFYFLLMCLCFAAVSWITDRDPSAWLAAATVIAAMSE